MQSKGFARTAIAAAALFSISACSSLTSLKDQFIGGGGPAAGPERLAGFIGAAVADEPRAALEAREILARGGSAADAAVALGFTLAVTYPSRAGLGSGGACLAYSPGKDGPAGGRPEAIMFMPQAPAQTPPGADRPAAVPMLARGLYLLYARYGRLPFESLLAGPEQLAKFGVPVSRALATDLAVVAGPLGEDPNARAIFTPNGKPLAEGGRITQPDLGATLSQLRTAGVGDLYQGALARRLAAASRLAGGPLTVDEMRAAVPSAAAPLSLPAGNDLVAFLPPPADGGLAAAASFKTLYSNPRDIAAAQAVAVGTAVRARQGGVDPNALLASPAAGGSLSPLPASTGFAVLDKNGNSVACELTMGNLFGTGRIAPGTGIVLGASPRAYTPPLLAAAIAWNEPLEAFRAVVAGSGQDGAPLAVAAGMANALRANTAMPAPVPEPGRADVIACSRYLPGNESACSWAADPRGHGLAAASN